MYHISINWCVGKKKQLVLNSWWWFIRLDYFKESDWWRITTNEKFLRKKILFKISKNLKLKSKISFQIDWKMFNCVNKKIYGYDGSLSVQSIVQSRDDDFHSNYCPSFSLLFDHIIDYVSVHRRKKSILFVLCNSSVSFVF